MSFKRKGLLGFLVVGLFCLMCVLILIFFPREPSERESDRRSREKHVARSGSAERKVPASRTSLQGASAEGRRSFAVLVSRGMSGRLLNYSRQILSWMKEWGFDCGFVTVQGSDGQEEASPALPRDVADTAWSLSEASSKLNAIVVADGDLGASQAAPLKEYIMAGGWLIVSSPEDGGPSAEVEELLQLKPSRSATLMAPEEPQWESPLGAEEVRVLVSHPLASAFDVGSWLEWTGPPGKVLYSKGDEALPLLCFARPELPAVRLVPFGDGGVVHWNFPMRPGPLIEETDLKSLLGNTLSWLWGRASWTEPLEKEGSASGIVRRKNGEVLSGAKVTAQVYAEWGEPTESLEAISSAEGNFSLPILDPAIYWVKAKAEGYYQADLYLLARPEGAKDEQIEVLMLPEASIFGHAYYGPGEDHPAVAISVILAPNCRISPALGSETATDNSGYFSFDHLPGAQTFHLIARTDGWLGMQEAPVPLEGESREVDIHLETPIDVNGVTMNTATGQSLPGIEVLAKPQPGEGAKFLFANALTQRTTSDQEGKFVLKLLPGHWSLIGQAAGFSAMLKSNRGRFNDVAVLESGEIDPSKIVVELCPHAVLHGTVFASSGKPAPEAKVTVCSPESYGSNLRRVLEYWTDDEGRYQTDPVRPILAEAHDPAFEVTAEWRDESGYTYPSFLLAKAGGSRPEQSKGSYVELLEGMCPLDIHLKPQEPESEYRGQRVSGTVLGAAGEPVGFAVVDLAWASPGGAGFSAYPQKKAISDPQGKFEFLGVNNGFWLIRARKKVRDAEGKLSLLWGETWQAIVDEVPVSSLEVKLSEAYIHGRALRADGAPVRDRYASFSLTFHTGCQERLGIFLEEDGGFALFPCGYAVLTRPSIAAWREAQQGKREKSRERGGHPNDAVIDAMLAEQRFHQMLILWKRHDLPTEGYASLTANIDGVRMELGCVKLGEESLTVTLPPEGAVRGRVVDADTGNPIPHAYVSEYRENRGLTYCKSDSQGRFSFIKLDSGSCTLLAMQRGYWSRPKQVEVLEGEEVYVEIELWAYWTIRGRLLLEETGEPIVAEIYTKDGVYTSKPDGTFAILAMASSDPRALRLDRYGFTVAPEGTGLKPFRKVVKRDPWVREVDVGDILVEREREQGEEGGEER